MLWHEKSWPELQAVDRNIPVVIPLGSCEQHGHHMPLFVDTIQVTSIAERVEKELAGEVLFTPVLWLGSSHHHKDYPGTISVTPFLYSKVIEEITDSVIRAGFKRIFFLNGHGGNEVPGSQALSEIVAKRDDANDLYLAFASWWKVGADALKPEKHGMTTPAVTHACEYETSAMLFLRPDLVHTDRIKEGKVALDNSWLNTDYGGKVEVYRRYHRFTASGSMGKPSAGTQEKGESMVAAVVEDIVKFIKEFASWPELKALGPK